MEPYLTIAGRGMEEFEVKHSRFLCYTAPVTTTAEAEAFIAEIRQKHWDARHNVPVYVLRGGIQHSSDDGEPQGTAGRPALGVLLAQEVTDCCVVITRYFGGVLLGTGGLVRAYSQGASAAIRAAGLLRMEPVYNVRIKCDYTLYGRIPALTAELSGTAADTDFADIVTADILLPTDKFETLSARIMEMSSGTCIPEITGEE